MRNADHFDDDSTRAEPGAPGAAENPLLIVHRRLRGRYPLAIGLALVLAIPGGVVGYLLKPPKFTSTGIVQVTPTLPSILYRETPETQMPADFNSHVRAQASFLTSRRVLDKAVENSALTTVGWPTGIQGVAELERTISIGHTRGEQLIYVIGEHAEPARAQRAVNAVLDAYDQLFGEIQSIDVAHKLRTLREREKDLDRRLQQNRDTARELSEGYGPELMVKIHQQRVAELEDAERRVRDLTASVALAQRRAETGGAGSELDPETLRELMYAQDDTLRTLRDQLSSLEIRFETMSAKYGENHRVMRQLRDSIDEKQALIADRMSKLAESYERGVELGGVTSTQLTLPQLRARLDAAINRENELHQESARIGGKLALLQDVLGDIDRLDEDLGNTRSRIDMIEVETQNGRAERVVIVQRGELPVRPRDRRPLLAAAGACGGAGIGLGLVFLLGLLDPRYRYIDDVEHGALSAPLLGTLPDLDQKHPEHDQLAALSVHHLRNMLHLQINWRPESGKARVYSVTSASAGDGKTSLSLALGMSFAVSGRRTLIIDADLVGCGMSRELNLVNAAGLRQVMRGDSLESCLQETTVRGLLALPVGDDDDLEAQHLSHEALANLIEASRQQFDVVLIDSGPLLGSLEANLAATIADGVVLAVSRGQSHKLAEACLGRLDRMGARCAGVVFNRAKTSDFESSVSANSFFSQSVRFSSTAPTSPLVGRLATGTRGALARAVVGGGAAAVDHADLERRVAGDHASA